MEKLLATEQLQTLFEQQIGTPEIVILTINQHQIQLDYRQHQAWADEQEINLTAMEVFLFERLAHSQIPLSAPSSWSRLPTIW